MSSDSADSLPHPRLIGLVESYSGSVLSGFPAGVHVGTPGLFPTVILTLRDRPVRYANQPGREPLSYSALVAGLHTTPAFITHDGTTASLTIHLTLAGAGRLLGVPVRHLLGSVAPATEILGPSVEAVRERIEHLDTWPERFAVVDNYLLQHLRSHPREDGLAYAAWRLIQSGQGGIRVSTVANRLGCSQRAVHSALRRQAGLGPKTLSRIARFNTARTLVHDRLIHRNRTPTLADLAAECGYYDESHLIREWTAFTGTTPADWRTRDELAFHQATRTG